MERAHTHVAVVQDGQDLCVKSTMVSVPLHQVKIAVSASMGRTVLYATVHKLTLMETYVKTVCHGSICSIIVTQEPNIF